MKNSEKLFVASASLMLSSQAFAAELVPVVKTSMDGLAAIVSLVAIGFFSIMSIVGVMKLLSDNPQTVASGKRTLLVILGVGLLVVFGSQYFGGVIGGIEQFLKGGIFGLSAGR